MNPQSMSARVALVTFAAWINGCSTVSEPVGTQAQSVDTEASAPSVGLGFVLPPAAVGLPLTNINIETDSKLGATRRRGDEGAITAFLNGATMGSLNGDAAANHDFPFVGTADEHNNTVQNYFVGLGLPSDQILAVHVNSEMGSSGLAGQTPTPHFIAYSSVLSRAVQGVPVIESVAWAKLNNSRQYVAMTVFWPPIPESVVQDALALQTRLADPVQQAAYVARLPAGLPAGRVVIHHASSGSVTVADAAPSVAYDVPVSAGGMTSYFRHFDINASEFRLREELATPPAGARRK